MNKKLKNLIIAYELMLTGEIPECCSAAFDTYMHEYVANNLHGEFFDDSTVPKAILSWADIDEDYLEILDTIQINIIFMNMLIKSHASIEIEDVEQSAEDAEDEFFEAMDDIIDKV